MKKIPFWILLMMVFVSFLTIGWRLHDNSNSAEIAIEKNTPTPSKPEKTVAPIVYPAQAKKELLFKKVVLATPAPVAELKELVGDDYLAKVLGINRIDANHIKSGMEIIIPLDVNDLKDWHYMPESITTAKKIPKLIIVSQPVQAFGVYQNGMLVRSGPISSGKKTKQTPSGLFFVNWKGEEVTSTVDDEWILLWNMNIDNFAGISMHQYGLPGYPASHSCIRLTKRDAYWLYQWTENWTLHKGEIETEGTPVIVYGEYDFDTPSPWSLLPEDPTATDTDRPILENLVKGYLAEIKEGAIANIPLL